MTRQVLCGGLSTDWWRCSNWYSDNGKKMFRGLNRKVRYTAGEPAGVIYVIDCANFEADEDYQEHVHTHIHAYMPP